MHNRAAHKEDEEALKAFSTLHKDLYNNDEAVIRIAQAWGAIEQVLLEQQRNLVAPSNVDSIASTVLAISLNHKILQQFARRGTRLIRENQKKQTETTQ